MHGPASQFKCKETHFLDGPAAGLLRARALATQGNWSKALEAMKEEQTVAWAALDTAAGPCHQEPGVKELARETYSDKFQHMVEIGARRGSDRNLAVQTHDGTPWRFGSTATYLSGKRLGRSTCRC